MHAFMIVNINMYMHAYVCLQYLYLSYHKKLSCISYKHIKTDE